MFILINITCLPFINREVPTTNNIPIVPYQKTQIYDSISGDGKTPALLFHISGDVKTTNSKFSSK